jgi:hypothetical protein
MIDGVTVGAGLLVGAAEDLAWSGCVGFVGQSGEEAVEQVVMGWECQVNGWSWLLSLPRSRLIGGLIRMCRVGRAKPRRRLVCFGY